MNVEKNVLKVVLKKFRCWVVYLNFSIHNPLAQMKLAYAWLFGNSASYKIKNPTVNRFNVYLYCHRQFRNSVFLH